MTVFFVNRRLLSRRLWRWLALAISLVCTSTVWAAGFSVEANRTEMALTETLSVTLRFTGGTAAGQPDFSTWEENFDILSQGMSSQMVYDQNGIREQQEWQLILAPKRAGALELAPLRLGSYLSDALVITVKEAANAPVPSGDERVLVETRLSKASVYVQEEFIVTYKLYLQDELEDYDIEPFAVTGADVKPLPQTQYQTDLKGQRFTVIELAFSVVPSQSGNLAIPAFRWALRTSMQKPGYWGRGQSQLHQLQTDALSVTVKPIPASYPPNTPWLPARRLTLTQQWGQGQTAQSVQFVEGDPATRSVSISASGLSAELLPPLTNAMTSAQFKSYPESPKLTTDVLRSGRESLRTDTLALIPSQSGHLLLPAIEIPWWNTDTDQLEVARLPEESLTASANPQAVTAPKAATSDLAPRQAIPLNAATPVAPESTAPDRLWIALLGWVLAAVLLGLNLLQFFQRARRPETASTQPSAKPLASERYWQAAKAAAQQNAARDCWAALSRWHQACRREQGPQSPTHLLGQLQAAGASPQLREAVDQLAASLYSTQADSWSGRSLAEALDSLSPRPKAQTGPLAPLYA
jgi:hypothetical protein